MKTIIFFIYPIALLKAKPGNILMSGGKYEISDKYMQYL